MLIVGIIPARYASTRLQGKPLCLIGNKTMIQRVYEQAIQADLLNQVWIATDDERIYQHARTFTQNVLMTAEHHPSGTDRCAEAAGMLPHQPDVVVNIQGDEPFLAPEQVNQLAQLCLQPHVQIATPIKKINQPSHLQNPAIPKVVIDHAGRALYFSRQAIPYVRDGEPNQLNAACYYSHVGLYAFKTETLLELVKLPPSMLEQAEKLEQLRWLENGYTIHTCLTQHNNFAIDTPQDLAKAQQAIMNS